MNHRQLAPLLTWVAAKYAEELDVQFLQGPVEDLWGRHIVWLFLLTKGEEIDPRDGQAMANFIDGLSDEMMAPARQVFIETVRRRLAVLADYGQQPNNAGDAGDAS